MFASLLSHGPLELILFLIVAAAIFFVVRRIRKRERFIAPTAAGGEDLPDLPTDVRVQATVRRIVRDPAQGGWVVEAAIGQRKFTFCPTDFTSEIYQPLLNQKVDFALYGLATLMAGGVEAMRDQISDIDRVTVTESMVRLIPVAGLANDYAVIGRIVSAHDESLLGDPVKVYRTEVVRQEDLTLILDLAVEPTSAPFSDGSMVHGSARLYGRLTED